jgi:hypothetical protein
MDKVFNNAIRYLVGELMKGRGEGGIRGGKEFGGGIIRRGRRP